MSNTLCPECGMFQPPRPDGFCRNCGPVRNLAAIMSDADGASSEYPFSDESRARAVLASDWLADIVAAARAEERERVATAIEALKFPADPYWRNGYGLAKKDAAAVARSAPSTTEPGDER